MKIELTESMATAMEDTIIGAIYKSETLKDLINNANCVDLSIHYTNVSEDEESFRIYYGSVYNKDEYERFINHNKLPYINLRTDDFDIDIKADSFERECFIEVVEHDKTRINEVIKRMLNGEKFSQDEVYEMVIGDKTNENNNK